MRAGRIVEVGAPETLYRTPRTAYVARFLGGSNVVEDARLAERLAGEPPPPGHVLAIRPEHLRPAAASASDLGSSTATSVVLRARQFLGTHSEWDVDAAGSALRLWVDPDTPVPDRLALVADRWRWVEAD
ncbi:MAG: TOBE domain-containing protein [Bacteroidota bacterium]